MATYTVKAPDGKTITLEGPEGASHDEVIAQAQKLYKLNAPRSKSVSESLGVTNPIGKGLMDAVEGVGAGVLSTARGASQIAHKVIPAIPELPAEYAQAPESIPGQLGKFAEQTAEFMIPSSAAAKATKGAQLLTRAGAQALAGGSVSALQTGGDPTSTAVGAALGGGGELAGAAVSGAKQLLAKKAPTIANFADSFGGATPTQKERITKALGTLERDGVMPADNVHGMQDAIKTRIQEIGQQYQALDPAIKSRTLPVADVVRELTDAQEPYLRRGVVTDKAAVNAIKDQIKTVKKIAAQNGGMVQVDDLIHMKNLANDKTAFTSPDAEKSLWKRVGDAYRTVADKLAPETTPLNRDYQKYKDLEEIIDQNIARGKGVSPSGLSILESRAAAHGIGAAAGGAVGSVFGPGGSAAGAAIGGFFGPKVSKAAGQVLQNAIDAGTFQKLAPAKQQALRSMAAIGDNAGILKLLGVSAIEESATH